MTPDYALSLSLQGLSFLCRIEGGWHKLGDVPLEHADLDAALAELRKRGEKQAGGAALCKLILPQDQIKYLTLPTVEGDIEDTVAQALAQATPYALEDLSYDFVQTERGVQVAAVARETLGEAEDFARQHGFEPLCYVAMPNPDDFDGEPFFGPTSVAGELIEDPKTLGPDEVVIHILSEGDLPETKPAPAFATSRSVEGDGAAVPALPGAKRGMDAGVATKDKAQNTDQDAATSSLSDQETRFDPATLIAGLKPRPEANAQPRSRGATRTAPAAPSKTATSGKPLPPEPKAGKAKPAPDTKVAEAPPAQAQSAMADPTQATRGKPKFLGLILVALLILFLAGVAVWASLTSGDGLSGVFQGEDVPQIAMLPDPSTEDTALQPTNPEVITDSAMIEAMEDETALLLEPTPGSALDPVLDAVEPRPTGDAFYAATGIWDRVPAQPNAPISETADAIYLGSFETTQDTHDAVALPGASSFENDFGLEVQPNPIPAGSKVEFDERGLVIATVEGTPSPEGYTVFLGKPPRLPDSMPQRVVPVEVAETPDPVADAAQLAIASVRPKLRPENLTEQQERVTFGGSTLQELATFRPKIRPKALERTASIDSDAIRAATDQAIQQAAAGAFENATGQAITASLRPRPRPAGLAERFETARASQPVVAVPRAERVAPAIPTTASVARNATEQNAINLRKINLIGVYGANNDRRALVRLSSGRYKKVKVGDRIDGGKVAAIGSDELRYVKGKRNLVLKMPKG